MALRKTRKTEEKKLEEIDLSSEHSKKEARQMRDRIKEFERSIEKRLKLRDCLLEHEKQVLEAEYLALK